MATSKNPLPTKPVKTVADVLDNSLIVLDMLGWGQKAFQKRTGEVCALGALQIGVANHGLRRASNARTKFLHRYDDEALRLNNLYKEAQKLLQEAVARAEARRKKIALAKVKIDPYLPIWSWNDAKGRTAEEVLEVFRIARKLAK